MIAKENVTKRRGLMAELNDKRRKQGTGILLSPVLEIKEEVGHIC
jgi:hypothetical protein